MGYITAAELEKLAAGMGSSPYSRYLNSVLIEQ